MSEVIVCAEPGSQREAAEFVEGLGGRPETRSMRALKLPRKTQRLLVYLKGGESSGVLKTCLKLASKDKNLSVVVYSIGNGASRAAELGKIVGECRPKRTEICFDPAAVIKIFRLSPGSGKASAHDDAVSPKGISTLRKRLLLTQVDLAKSLGVSERTVQNWETGASLPDERQVRDLRELDGLLTRYIHKNQLSDWMTTSSDAFHGHSPRELILDGKARDIIIEFRRLQSGEPL
jgi:transcriptional regulator with XRE-family HTH domain